MHKPHLDLYDIIDLLLITQSLELYHVLISTPSQVGRLMGREDFPFLVPTDVGGTQDPALHHRDLFYRFVIP